MAGTDMGAGAALPVLGGGSARFATDGCMTCKWYSPGSHTTAVTVPVARSYWASAPPDPDATVVPAGAPATHDPEAEVAVVVAAAAEEDVVEASAA
jgi:hypothetical protein